MSTKSDDELFALIEAHRARLVQMVKDLRAAGVTEPIQIMTVSSYDFSTSVTFDRGDRMFFVALDGASCRMWSSVRESVNRVSVGPTVSDVVADVLGVSDAPR